MTSTGYSHTTVCRKVLVFAICGAWQLLGCLQDSKLKILSLFSGVGGLELGLSRSGTKMSTCNDSFISYTHPLVHLYMLYHGLTRLCRALGYAATLVFLSWSENLAKRPSEFFQWKCQGRTVPRLPKSPGPAYGRRVLTGRPNI